MFARTSWILDEQAGRHEGRLIPAGSAREATHDLHELRRVERLAEERLGVAAIRLMLGVIYAGEDHQRHVPKSLSKRERERGAVDARHLDVQDDDGGRIVLDLTHRLRPIARLDDTESGLGEDRALGRARRLIVVDDENRACKTLT